MTTPTDDAGGVPASGARERVIVLATRSAGKLRELAPLLAEHGWEALTLETLGVPALPDEDALEQFDTFRENALAKARYFAARTGRIVVADDSGLVVDALDGRPGVHSKRWSGSALAGEALDAFNNRYLQERLQEAAAAGRTSRQAAYVCAAACAWAGGELVTEGRTEGTLLESPDGEGGFGYDPFFRSTDLQATFASVGHEAKASVSHRGRAFRVLLNELESFFAAPVDPRPCSG